MGLAVRQDATNSAAKRVDPLCKHAKPLQPRLPRGGAGDDPAL